MATILLADDEHCVRKMLREILEDKGHRLLQAADGQEALALTRASRPDLIITDVAMPVMDGYELVHRLRADPALRGTPVIVCTGVYDRQEVESLTGAGGVQVLLKPFTPDDIGVAVAAAVGGAVSADRGGSDGVVPGEEFDREHLQLLATKLSHKATELERESLERRRVEAALRESEERFRSAMEHAAIGMALVGLDGRWLSVNRALCELTGYSEQELLGLTFQEITHPDDLDADLGHVRQLLSGELRSFQMEKRYFRKGGGVVWALLSVSMVQDAVGQPSYFIAQVQDITARHQAEAALRDSEALYHSLVDSLPQNILRKDLEGRYIFANSNFCAMLGLSPEAIIGKTDSDFFPARLAEKYRRDDREVIRAGKNFEAVEENLLPGGERMYVQVSKSPVRDARGRAVGVQAIFWDVTQQEQAKEALRRSEERLRSLMEQAADAMIVLDRGGRVIEVNRQAQESLGYAREALLGLLFGDLDDTFTPESLAVLWECASAGPPVTVEGVHRRRDGSKFPVEMRVGLFEAHEHQHLLATVRDISERRRSEEAMWQAQRFLQSTLDALSAHIAILDERGEIIEVNAAWRRFAAANACREADCGVGRNYLEVCEAAAGQPAARAAAAGIREVIAGRRRDYYLEYPCDSPDERRWFALRVTRFGGDGPVRVVVAHENVTERKLTEEALRKAHRETERLLSAIQSILIAVDVGSRVTRWNQAAKELTGLAESEVIGRPLGALPAVWGVPDIQAFIAESIARGRQVRLDDVRCRRADGKEAILGVMFQPFKGEEGAPAGCLIIGADVTERRVLEGQLRQAQKLESIGQLAAGIAHEINTPLQYVGDNTRFLDDAFRELTALLDGLAALARPAHAGAPPNPLAARISAKVEEADVEYLSREIPKAIQQSLEGIGRVTKIVQSMKDFAHPGAAEKTAADLGKAIDSTLTVARNEWKYVAEVETDFDPALPPVPCLLGEFNQVVLNILINAAHAVADVVGDGSRGKGLIRVSTRREGAWAVVRISDTGTGIPEKAREKIFDPFFTTKQVGKGTGQGLAISHTVIVEKHGGQISFETELGKGTTFIIRLPLGETAA